MTTSVLSFPKDEVTFQLEQESNMLNLADVNPYGERRCGGSVLSPVTVSLSSHPPARPCFPAGAQCGRRTAELQLRMTTDGWR